MGLRMLGSGAGGRREEGGEYGGCAVSARLPRGGVSGEGQGAFGDRLSPTLPRASNCDNQYYVPRDRQGVFPQSTEREESPASFASAIKARKGFTHSRLLASERCWFDRQQRCRGTGMQPQSASSPRLLQSKLAGINIYGQQKKCVHSQSAWSLRTGV